MSLDIALACARRGWPVFPNGEDNPLVKWKYGPTPATTDEGQIRQWWRWWPNARVGLVMGEKSGLVAADLDEKHGHHGIAAFADLVRRHGPVPHGLRWRTRTGGLHLLFRHPGFRIPNSVSKLAPGVDIRGDGGFVVAYRAPGPADAIPPLPEWLAALAANPAPRAIPVINASVKSVRSPRARWTAAIKGECADVAATRITERNERLYMAAVALSRFIPAGLDPEIIRAALLDAAMRCGLPDKEARDSIQSAFTWRAGISA